MNISRLVINKNRGWRGLAEVKGVDAGVVQYTTIFSFSQDMWNDLLSGHIVLADEEYYYVVEFNNIEGLPKPHQQRSVLIKNWQGEVISVHSYNRNSWGEKATEYGDYSYISNHKRNRNNHTTSDWNCIGVRVRPSI